MYVSLGGIIHVPYRGPTCSANSYRITTPPETTSSQVRKTKNFIPLRMNTCRSALRNSSGMNTYEKRGWEGPPRLALRNSLLAPLSSRMGAMFGKSFGALVTLGAIVLLACSLGAPTASAQAILTQIHASGSTHYSEQQIVAISGLKVGEPLTRERLQAVANDISQLGIFSRVSWTTSESDTVLTLQVEDAPVVPLWFDNFPWFSDKDILDSLHLAVPIFNGLVPRDGSLLDEIGDSLTTLLQTNKISGTIEHLLVAKPGSDDQVVQFRVVGPKLTIDSIHYTDELSQKSAKLEDRKTDIVGKPYSRFTIEMFVTEQVRPLYLQNGFLHARFEQPQANMPEGEKDAGKIGVTLRIEPGPAYKLKQVAWSGNTAITTQPFETLITGKRDQIADGVALEGVWQRVQREYNRRGYVDAKIDPQAEFSDANATVSYRVVINEGSLYRMGKLVITGLSLDAERAVRGAWKIAPNDVYDAAWVDDFLVKLQKPSPEIFGKLPVHYSEVGHLIVPGDAPNTMDVMIDFQR
jgi:outer membrane protein assembly factor BamA